MGIVLDILMPIVVGVLGIAIGWMLRGATKKTYGFLTVVEWPDKEPDVLMQIDVSPDTFEENQEIILVVHKTSRMSRG